jgi:hypothetical protein
MTKMNDDNDDDGNNNNDDDNDDDVRFKLGLFIKPILFRTSKKTQESNSLIREY